MNADRPGNGTAIPARTREEARTQASFIGLAGLGGDAGFRVNAGVFNPNDRADVVTFTVRDAAGNDLGIVERTWAAREWFQINDVLARRGRPRGRRRVPPHGRRPCPSTPSRSRSTTVRATPPGSSRASLPPGTDPGKPRRRAPHAGRPFS